MKRAEIKTTGVQRQAAREARKADWVAKAYAGLPFPSGPNRPLPARRHMKANPHRLSEPNPKNKHVLVLERSPTLEVRYHFTKGYRVGRP